MPPVVIGSIGLAAAVGGQVAQMSAQSRAASKQSQAIEEQVQSAQQRLQLATQQQQIIRQNAQVAWQKEQEQLKANHRQNLLAIQEQVLTSRLTELQSQQESFGIRNDARSQAMSLTKDAANQATQLYTESQNEQLGLDQANQQSDRELSAQRVAAAGRQGSPSTVNSAVLEGAQLNTEAMQGVQQNVASRASQARNTQKYAEDLARNLMEQADVAAGYVDSSQANQSQLTQGALSSARQQENIQNKRNLQAGKAAYLSAQAQNTTSYLGNVMAERSQISSANAQRGQIQRPGVLSYAALGIGAATQAYGSGLLSFNRSSQPSSMITQMPPQSSMIRQPPPVYSGFPTSQGFA
jgi:hypothetical protein